MTETTDYLVALRDTLWAACDRKDAIAPDGLPEDNGVKVRTSVLRALLDVVQEAQWMTDENDPDDPMTVVLCRLVDTVRAS